MELAARAMALEQSEGPPEDPQKARDGMAAGAKLGPYEIVAALGAGGMGEVYRARDTRLDRSVAIKILPAAFSADRERLHRFEREARLASALNHPNIVTIYELGQDGSTHYIAMELVEGKTLGELLVRRRAADTKRRLKSPRRLLRGWPRRMKRASRTGT